MSIIKPGQLAIISQDCRKGGVATGKHAIYKGDLPISVILFNSGEIIKEIDYFEGLIEQVEEVGYVSRRSFCDKAGKELGYTFPMTDENSTQAEQIKALSEVSAMARELESKPETYFYQVHENPALVLEDGSLIWGCECYWQPVKEKVKPEDLGSFLEASEESIKAFQKMMIDVLESPG